MVQAGAACDYDDLMDENPESAWTNVIRDAVKEFVRAVAESSNQLASAGEKFASEALASIDEAAARAERSAATSDDAAQVALKAAEDARVAAEGLQNSIAEASERIRSDSSAAAIQLTQVQEAGERLRSELQSHVDEMISRVESAAGSNQDAIAAAEQATNVARAAADQMQHSVSAVEAAVVIAQSAADEAREAAEASRQSAEHAVSKSSALGGEANMLLERLETDYDLLTRLVRELHSRISSLSLPTVPVTEPTAAEETPASEEPDNSLLEPGDTTPHFEAEPELESSPWPPIQDENMTWEVAVAEAATEPVIETPVEATVEAPADFQASDSPYVDDGTVAGEAPAPEAPIEPMAETPAEVEASYTPYISEETPVWDIAAVEPEIIDDATEEASASIEESAESAYEAPGYEAQAESSDPQASYETPAYEMPEPMAQATDTEVPETVDTVEHTQEAETPTSNNPSVSGRVQVRIAPVPDFDRLLSLDGALTRVSGVASVTLADYSQEEVTFRVEVLGAKDADVFARELAAAAGLNATLVDAADDGVIIRID